MNGVCPYDLDLFKVLPCKSPFLDSHTEFLLILDIE
jgi:hypothetical protein